MCTTLSPSRVIFVIFSVLYRYLFGIRSSQVRDFDLHLTLINCSRYSSSLPFPFSSNQPSILSIHLNTSLPKALNQGFVIRTSSLSYPQFRCFGNYPTSLSALRLLVPSCFVFSSSGCCLFGIQWKILSSISLILGYT